MQNGKPYLLDTGQLREQHAVASAMIDRLLKQSEPCDTRDQAYCLALQVAKLASLLRVHFAQEDCILYAALFDCGDPEISRIALDYFQDLSGIAEKLEMFAFRWCSPDTIHAGYASFRAELGTMCNSLLRRIALENAYLYPLAETILARRLAA